MSEITNLSYSMQLDIGAAPSNPAPSASEDQRTYAYADCEQIPLNEHTVLLVNRRKRNRMVVTRDVANALTYCTHYSTLAEHADRLCASVPMLRDQQADVRQVLASVRDAGVLASGEETAARLRTAADAPTPAPARVFILTCDRPAAVERLLDSLLATCQLACYQHLLLVDDSRQPENAARNRQLVERFNRSSPKAMLYVGAQAAADLLSRLIEALPACEQGLRLLLDRERWAGQASYGLARNLALLLSVGCRALVLDDDIVCGVAQAPVAEPGVAFSPHSASQAWFYTDVQELLRHSQRGACDPLARQLEHLGRPLGAVLEGLAQGPLDEVALAGCDAAVLAALDGASPVLVTQCGSAGDPGTGGPGWMVKLDAASLRRWLSSGTDRDALPESRRCWLGHTRPTVTPRGVISQLTGLDNSQLLPPYAPVLRGEDELFATMTARLHPQSAVLNGNWAVPHLPLEDRAGRSSARPAAPGIGLGVLAGYLRGHGAVGNGGVEARLAALAAELRALGEMPLGDLLGICEVELAHHRAALLQQLDARIAEFRGVDHPAWQSLLANFAGDTRAALLAGIGDDESISRRLASFREAALAFAQALDDWPAIRAQSAALTAQWLSSGEWLPARGG